jgi:hypothetical protein
MSEKPRFEASACIWQALTDWQPEISDHHDARLRV